MRRQGTITYTVSLSSANAAPVSVNYIARAMEVQLQAVILLLLLVV